jgi:hypothetical protein
LREWLVLRLVLQVGAKWWFEGGLCAAGGCQWQCAKLVGKVTWGREMAKLRELQVLRLVLHVSVR